MDPRKSHRGLRAAPKASACLAALAGLLALAGCRTAEVASYNLDRLMTPDDNFAYVADVQSGWRFYMRQLINPSWLTEESTLRSKPHPIEDPTDVTLDNLLALAEEGTFVNDDQRLADQARHYARYATASPSALCRERALLELVPLGLELGLSEPVVDPVEPANAAELSEGLIGLTQALQPMLAPRAASATQVRDFVAACELLAGRDYDIAGGRRLLAIIGAFTASRRLERAEFAPLRKLSEDVARDVVAQALALGLKDGVPFVRAAAYRANWLVYGDAVLEEALASLIHDPQDQDRRTPLLGLRTVRPHEEAVIVETLSIVREHGLPQRARGANLEAREVRYFTLLLIAQIAYDFSTFGDRPRTAAMLALQEVSGAPLSTLREEEWSRWWQSYRDRELPEIERLRKEAAERAADRPPSGDDQP